jgi:hypothetical protein
MLVGFYLFCYVCIMYLRIDFCPSYSTEPTDFLTRWYKLIPHIEHQNELLITILQKLRICVRIRSQTLRKPCSNAKFSPKCSETTYDLVFSETRRLYFFLLQIEEHFSIVSKKQFAIIAESIKHYRNDRQPH